MSENSAAAPTPTRAIALLALASFVSAANLRICDSLLPQIASDLGVTIGAAATMVTAFAIAYGLFQIAVGPLGDARGKLPIVVLGCLWAGFATMLCAAMPTLTPIVLLRFLGGAGGAAIIPLAIAWLGDVIPYERRQPMLARFASGQILGVVFGQAVGGVLGELIGWRGTLLVLGIAHITSGLLLIGEMRRHTAANVVSGRARWREAGTHAYGLLQRRWVRVVLATTFLEGLLMFGAFAYIGSELHHRFGIGYGLVGVMLATFGGGALCYSLSAGWLIPRLGQSGLAAVGSVLLAVGYTMLAFTAWLWVVPLAMAVLGVGLYMLHNTLQTVATQMAPEARGLSISLFAFVLFTGQSVGVAAAAPVVDRYGAWPVFLIAAASLPAVALWFRGELLGRCAGD